MKPNAALSKLIIRDLAEFSGMKFTYPDRLTRAEAGQVEQWARANPDVVRAYTDRGHAENASVRLFADTVRYFQADHPQGAAGEAAPWPAPSADELRAVGPNPFGVKTAAEAQALLAWAQTRPEYRDAYMNKNHPQHKDYVEQTQQLLTIVHPEAPAEPGQVDTVAASAAREQRSPVPAGAPSAGEVAAQRARIAELQKNPAYMDRSHPGHKDAVAAVTRAYEAAYSEPAPGAPGGAAPAQSAPEAAQPPAGVPAGATLQ